MGWEVGETRYYLREDGAEHEEALPLGRFKIEMHGAYGSDASVKNVDGNAGSGGAGGYIEGELQVEDPMDVLMYLGEHADGPAGGQSELAAGGNGVLYQSTNEDYSGGGGGATIFASPMNEIFIHGGGGGGAMFRAYHTYGYGGGGGGANGPGGSAIDGDIQEDGEDGEPGAIDYPIGGEGGDAYIDRDRPVGEDGGGGGYDIQGEPLIDMVTEIGGAERDPNGDLHGWFKITCLELEEEPEPEFDVKVFDGSDFEEVENIKVKDGDEFVDVEDVKIRDGGEWV